MPTLSELIKTKIASGNKSKASVAAHLGVSERTIENYMKGKRQPKPEVLPMLAKFLGFDLNELYEHGADTGKNEVQDVRTEYKANGKAEHAPISYSQPIQERYIKLLEDSLKEKGDQLSELKTRISELEGRQRDFLAKLEGSLQRYEHLVEVQLQNRIAEAPQEQGNNPVGRHRTYKQTGIGQKKST